MRDFSLKFDIEEIDYSALEEFLLSFHVPHKRSIKRIEIQSYEGPSLSVKRRFYCFQMNFIPIEKVSPGEYFRDSIGLNLQERKGDWKSKLDMFWEIVHSTSAKKKLLKEFI